MQYLIIFLNFSQFVPYYISIYQGNTKPSVSGWLCYLLSLLVTILASIQLHSYNILIAFGMSVICELGIIIICLKRKQAFKPTNYEKFILAMIVFSIIIWLLFGDPNLAIYLNAVIVLLGTILVIYKLIQHPLTESYLTWCLGSISSGISFTFFLHKTHFADDLYLILIFACNVAIFLILNWQQFYYKQNKSLQLHKK